MTGDDPMHDDSSHYEVSLTATQALVAFVLLLLSLAAAFGFGFVIGKGRTDGAATARNEQPVIREGEVEADDVTIRDLGDPGDESGVDLGVPGPAEAEEPRARVVEEDRTPSAEPPPSDPGEPDVAHVAQLLSTTEAAPAEELAARLIEQGFTSAYVERVRSEEGMIYRVRVRFDSEQAARASRDRLQTFAPGEIWISRAE